MKQAEIFLNGEGTAWLKRNRADLSTKNDLVLETMDEMVGMPTGAYLEIGCSNGWRLEALKARGNDVYGIEPSQPAVKEAHKKGLANVAFGTAINLPWLLHTFDVVIYGFCLYLVDREDLFTVVKEGDRVLRDGGHLVIHDFAPGSYPHKKAYKHKKGVWSYHQNYPDLFDGNPAYSVVYVKTDLDKGEQVTILRKDIERGWPECGDQ